VPHAARTTPIDAERIARATARPVGGDHVGGVHRNVLPGDDGLGGHSVLVLGEADHLGREPHVGVGQGPLPQDRLQGLL
jgi:hypothetical protein